MFSSPFWDLPAAGGLRPGGGPSTPGRGDAGDHHSAELDRFEASKIYGKAMKITIFMGKQWKITIFKRKSMKIIIFNGKTMENQMNYDAVSYSP